MHLDDARLFATVARSDSLSAAARTLDRSPAAVSAAVKRLEQTLEVRLLHRSTRAMELTPEGRTFLEGCRELLAVWEQAETRLLEARHGVPGPLRIAAPIDLAQQHLGRWLAEFADAHPRIQITLTTSDALLALPTGGIDLAIRYGLLDDTALVATRLCSTDRIVVGSPALIASLGRPRHPRELVDWPVVCWLRNDRPHTHWQLTRGDEIGDVEVQPRLCGDGSTVRAWALEGVGLACKSRTDVAGDLAAGRLVDVFPDWTGEELPLTAVLPAGRLKSARVEALLAWLRPRLRELAATGRSQASKG